ncbi:4'-phosphopantetheinyl transferase superfamily protein [Herbaspirillum sp. 1130]|uniref:4'-phosphopantetheinyl transferase family protein n=1 Tax=Herbaspirillum sp. 1130 TaxID=2806562 RepID=UPI001AE5243A|nr:4'-phosphopantetheinyl transferase superfamily protein [Herbaspirillum sp. 1130]MBP1313414.1 4'-phosphopantetheinyl transferase [Herbaspirillum sp. 1130]
MRPVQLPDGAPCELALWRLDLDIRAPVPQLDWMLLTPAEKAFNQRFRQPGDRVRHACTRAALRRLLALRLHMQPQQVPLRCSARGKPLLDMEMGAGRLAFNVSHAGCHALIAISTRGDVGVDIECCDPDLDVAALEALVLSPEELAATPSHRLDFTERWVVKEAVLKAIGSGVSEHLQQLCVARAAERYLLRHRQRDWPHLCAWPLPAPAGYRAALAYAWPTF